MKTLFSTVLGLGLLASGTAIAAPVPSAHDAGHRARTASAPAAKQRAQHAHAQPVLLSARPAAHLHAQPVRQQAQPRGHVSRQNPRKGDHLPAGHRGVVINDWRTQGLRSPGRGQQWRQLDGRYALIATASGLIVEILGARR